MADFTEFLWPLSLPEEIRVKAIRLQNTQQLSRADLRRKQRQVGQDLLRELFLQRHGSEKDVISSITHSGHSIYGIVAEQKHFSHLGLDSEAIITQARADRLAQRVLTPHERAHWSQANLSWAEFVTLIFSLKEAAYKALSKSEQKGLGFQNFLVEWGGFGIETHIQVAIQPSNHEKPQKLSGNFVVFDNQVLCAVWQAPRSQVA